MIGSSNFTSRGLGLSKQANNLEANLLYLVDANRFPLAYKQLYFVFPESEIVEGEPRFKPLPNQEEEEMEEIILLPVAFVDAIYACEEGQNATVTFQFDGSPPIGWQLFKEDNGECYFDEASWKELGEPSSVERRWVDDRPPSGFDVRWQGISGSAWLPVNIRSAETLPPPSELKNLSLDQLIDILSSARPLHRVVADHLRRKNKKTDGVEKINPHDPRKIVDTSKFLLQRTRRISAALEKLGERLAQPAATIESLRWRLHGPVGVMALARAIVSEQNSNAERAFLLSELALELARVKPQRISGYLDPKRHEAEINSVIAELKKLVPARSDDEPQNIRRYVETIFERITS